MGAAILVVMTTAAAGQFGISPVPEPGILLLRNGQTIEGRISRAGDLYYVALPNGEVRIKAAEVEACCRDFEDGYHTKRAAIQTGDVQEHLRLAQWCLRNDLLSHAGSELADARKAQPRHPMIEVLQRRLTLAEASQGAARSSARREPARPVTQTGQPSPEDLDRLVDGLPSGVVESFTKTIQPLLSNNCSAAACHGPGTAAKFRLLRIPIGRPPSRLTTQRNLHATMQWVDRNNPAASSLLTAAARPHGGEKGGGKTGGGPPFHANRLLVAWVDLLAARPTPEVPATVTQGAEPPVRAMPAESPGFVFPDPAAPPTPDRHPEMKPSVADPFGKTFPRHPDQPGLPYEPIDPFDPEIFNRRYFRER